MRAMETRDIRAVLAIQGASPEIAQWTEADYDFAGRAGTFGWVAEDDKRIPGFLVARQVLDEVEILNIAVHEDFRRRGIATELLSAAVKNSCDHGAAKVYLEVRASNGPAIEFYKRYGFREFGRRARYYASPPDDALMLALQIGKI